ncbi:MAG: flagellar export chaperone FliS [Gracilibacteraceae bacterium]|jgi:flagellar protein FliS|nr:flagellar export chaperone FliS [Gracilibacteraceae bacterium]
MAVPNPYQNYKQQSIYMMTPPELLLLLYDELVKRVHLSMKALEAKEVDAAHKNLLRAQDIIRYLSVTLKDGYEISEVLDSLYDYFLQQLVLANVRKDPLILEEILPMIEELRDAWQQAKKNYRE